MAVNEIIVTGRKFRKCIDEINKKWQRYSFWGKAEDTEFDDGKNAETKLGAIDGITDSLASTSSRIAASAKAVSTLSNDLAFPDGMKFYPDIKNGVRGYNTEAARGADTFFPFKQSPILLASNISSLNTYSHICTTIANYQKLTADNFFTVFKTIGKTTLGSNNTGTFTKSYDPTTGKFNIGKYYQYQDSSSHIAMYVIYDLYLVK